MTVRVEDVAERKWRIVSAEPVRTMVELTYKGWKVAGREVNLTSRMTQWSGERGFDHRVIAEGADGLTLVTGIVRQPELEEKSFNSTADAPVFTRAWWGHQVEEEGPPATAIDMLPNQNLGLAIIALGQESKSIADDPLNLLVQPQFQNGKAEWYVTGLWDQEDTDELNVSAGQADSRFRYGTLALPPPSAKTFDGFVNFVRQVSSRVAQPARVEIVSTSASAQSAPPDTLKPAKKKTYAQAIELLKQSAER